MGIALLEAQHHIQQRQEGSTEVILSRDVFHIYLKPYRLQILFLKRSQSLPSYDKQSYQLERKARWFGTVCNFMSKNSHPEKIPGCYKPRNTWWMGSSTRASNVLSQLALVHTMSLQGLMMTTFDISYFQVPITSSYLRMSHRSIKLRN